MKLDSIAFEPNTKYMAEGIQRVGSDGSEFKLGVIQLETDGGGRVIWFNDLWSDDVCLANSWDYVKLRNETTGRTMDLRLHTAAASGNVAMAREALAEFADVGLRMKQGATPLHWAAAHGKFEVASLLIKHHADVNSVDDLGWTPIHLAARGRHQGMVRLLHQSGASLHATIQGHSVSLTLRNDSDEELLQGAKLLEAVEREDLEGVERALENGANVNYWTGDGWTPLLASAKTDLAIVQRLIEAGADPNIASHHGYTPLMRAAGHNAVDVVRLLITAGTDVEARDHKGFSARDMALQQGCSDAAEIVGEAVRDRLLRSGKAVIPIGSCEALFHLQYIHGLRIAPGYHRVRADLSDGTRLHEARVYDTILLEVPQEHVGKKVVKLEVLYPD